MIRVWFFHACIPWPSLVLSALCPWVTTFLLLFIFRANSLAPFDVHVLFMSNCLPISILRHLVTQLLLLCVLSHVWLLQTHRLSARLLCLWDSPGKNTGAGCHFLLKGIFLTQELNPSLLHCRQTFYWLRYKGSPWEASLRGKGAMTTLVSSGCTGVSWGSGFLLPALYQGAFTEGDESSWSYKVTCFSIV